MALISVILPCYNVEQYIDRCLLSITEQSIGLDNIEIICVDDFSTDKTLEKLLSWEKRYPENMMIVQNSINCRQGAARNIGLNYSTADYVTFVDSDDWLEKDYLEILYKEITTNDLQVVSCQLQRDSSIDYTLWNNNADYQKNLYIINNDNDRKFVIMNQVLGGACCKLIQKKFLLENNIIYPEYLCYEDLYWREVLHLNFTRGMVIDKKLYHYYVNPNSTTLGTNAKYHMDYFTIVARLWDYFANNDFLDKFKYELEYEYLIIAGLQIMKVLALRFSDSQYSAFRLLQTILRQRIPSFSENIYISSKYFSEIQLLIINSFYTDLSKYEYDELIDAIKKVGL